jgi:hypothetical protein
MALVARFDGYEPGYSTRLGLDRNFLTWVVLKAHTHNAAGRVTLRSADPREPPRVHMRQFSGDDDRDLRAVVEGVRFVRGLNERLRAHGTGATEVLPGSAVASDEAVADHVRHSAGHHACAPAPSAGTRGGGVLDGQFRHARHDRPAGGRRLGLPAHPRIFHRQCRLHDWREGRRRDSRGRSAASGEAVMPVRPAIDNLPELRAICASFAPTPSGSRSLGGHAHGA